MLEPLTASLLHRGQQIVRQNVYTLFSLPLFTHYSVYHCLYTIQFTIVYTLFSLPLLRATFASISCS